MRYLLFLLLFIAACDDEQPQQPGTELTDTFLQRMAARAGNARKGGDSTLDCALVLQRVLLTSNLYKKNKSFDTVARIKKHPFTIAHTTGDDSILIWINYKVDDTATMRTLAWLELDMNSGRLYDVTAPGKHAPTILFDTTQMQSIRCSCAYADKAETSTPVIHATRTRDKMIRNTEYTELPDYGKVF